MGMTGSRMLGQAATPARPPLPLPLLLKFAAVAGVGLAALIGGLLWDAAMHGADEMLAASEGVFALGNPAHVLFGGGVFLASVGLAGMVALVLRAVRPPRSSP
jgi:hypothetical protein